MTVVDVIIFGIVDLSVLAAIKMICSAWVASKATKQMDSETLKEFMRRAREDEDEL